MEFGHCYTTGLEEKTLKIIDQQISDTVGKASEVSLVRSRRFNHTLWKVIKANTFFKICAITKPLSTRTDGEMRNHWIISS